MKDSRPRCGLTLGAFSVSVETFYETRYVKIAQTMHDIDRVGDAMIETFGGVTLFDGVAQTIRL